MEYEDTDTKVLSIYKEALERIGDARILFLKEGINTPELLEDLRAILVSHTISTRQNSGARIARKALKDASYERIYGSRSQS